MQNFGNRKSVSSANLRGRGYSQNSPNRFEHIITEREEEFLNSDKKIILTELSSSPAKSIITVNQSPDVPFERSVNAYRGCEHGCIYCFARPSHSYLDLSPGLDFETKIFFKSNAAELLRNEFIKPSYEVKTISLGNITDVYQPVEKRLGITRELLKLFLKFRHPVSLATKSSLIERDIDIYQKLAKLNLVHVAITITTLDSELARKLEPRATLPKRRLQTIRKLSDCGVPVSVLIAPIIPVLNDHGMENILEECKAHGASGSNFVILRLPHELKDLFTNWLENHYPLKAQHVLSRLKEMHKGRLYQSNFGARMRGSGHYADMIEKRFRLACKTTGLDQNFYELDHTKFIRSPIHKATQLEMF